MSERLTLRIEEVADRLGLSAAKVWQLVHRGELPSFKVDRTRFVSVEVLEQWVRDKAHQGIVDAASS